MLDRRPSRAHADLGLSADQIYRLTRLWSTRHCAALPAPGGDSNAIGGTT